MKISKSIVDPLKQPFSLFAMFVGGLSIFNMVRELGVVNVDTLVAYVDLIYVVSRDAVFYPVEILTGFEIPSFMKNIFVIYAVIARAYSSSVGFLLEEMSVPAPADAFHRTTWKSYRPLEQGPLKRKQGLIAAIVNRWPSEKAKGLARKVLMSVASFAWPYVLPSVLRHPKLSIRIEGPDQPGAPHPSNPGLTEMPPLDEFGTLKTSPKFPGTGRATLPRYNARHIFVTFFFSQFIVAAALITLNFLLPPLEP